MDSISELRQDIVSGDWVLIATGRAKRPDDFIQAKSSEPDRSKKDCPFDSIEEPSLLLFSSDGKKDKDDWWVQIIENKYPALGKGICKPYRTTGPYHWKDGVGFHEIVVTRDHTRPFAMMSEAEIELVLRAFQERYITIKDMDCVEYVSIFQNHGLRSGASISHPHSQIIAIPVIPPDVGRSINGSSRYYKEHNACVHCAVIEYEEDTKERIIYENEYMIVVAPYASKSAFEMRVFPKKHNAYFETMAPKERVALADALRVTLGKLYQGLKNPDYNFFLHTAPTANSEEYHHYHWHFEILPKTAIWAGFEIGTGIEISVITPEAAADFLRNITI